MEPSLGLALRTLAKPICAGGLAVAMLATQGVTTFLVGSLLLAMALSWLHFIGADCSHQHFFHSHAVNNVMAELANAPLLRGWPLDQHHPVAGRIFIFFVVPLLLMRAGPLFVLKYWVLPAALAHLNVLALSNGHKRSDDSAAYALLFPELDTLLDGVPVYSLDAAARRAALASKSASAAWHSYWPLALPTREMLLWRNRDWLLLSALALCIALLMSASALWALVPLALLLPFLVVKSRVAAALGEATSKRLAQPPMPPSAAVAASSRGPTLEALPLVSASELREHTQWVAVRGVVVDVERLALVHPGGDQIRAFGGTDASAAFASMHGLRADAHMSVLQRSFAVGRLDTSCAPFAPTADTPFARDVLQSVRDALRGMSPYAPWQWWVRTALIAAATLASECWWAFTASPWAMVVVGVLHAAIGVCVQHDASHGAVSANAAVNSAISYGADWIGNSRWLWMQQHVIGHHPHCNVEHADPDAHSAEPLLFFHDSWRAPLQWLYMYAVLPWYGPTVVYNVAQLVTMNHANEVPAARNAWLQRRIPAAVAMRLWYVARIVVAPCVLSPVLAQSWWWLLYTVLGIPLVAGAVLTFLFVVSHNFEGADRKPDPKGDLFKLQVETSATYGGWLAMVLTGGLNYQIEHHLVPRVNSWHYPRIAGAVRAACQRHGVRYTYFDSLAANVLSTVRYMGATPAVAAPAPSEPIHILIHGKRLDVTRWAQRHPGGAAVFAPFADRDATDQFAAMHSPAASRQLAAMLKSAPDAKCADDPVALAYRELRAELERDGFFTPSWVRDGLFMAQHAATYVVGTWLLCTGWNWSGALVYAWAMQQSGWLSHDHLHHSTFHERVWLGDWVGSVLGWLQGLDAVWWKDRHNMHHLVTNETGNDPDIDLGPFTYMDQHARQSLPGIRRWQHVYFLPLLSLLHVGWLVSSLRFTVRHKLHTRTLALLAHYAWMAWLFRDAGVAALLLVALFKGFLTAVFVFSTHYPEPRLPAGANHLSLAAQTALTSRNISGWGMDLLSGNISRQIEHHLFPTLPRSHLPLIAPRVKAMLARHGLPYNEAGLWECMSDNIQCLMCK